MMGRPLWESIIALVIDTKGKAGIVASAILDGGINPLARGSYPRDSFFSLLYSFISKHTVLRYDREEDFSSFYVVRNSRMLEELVIEEEEFLKLAGKSRLHYFLFMDPVIHMLGVKRVDILERRICLDITAKSPEGHVLKHSVTFGKYSLHRNKQGVLVFDDPGQAGMKEARAWLEAHFPKATRGKWKVADFVGDPSPF